MVTENEASARKQRERDTTAAALVILSEELTPQELEALIGLQADRTEPKGDPVAGGRGQRRFSVWRIDEKDGLTTADAQLAKILERSRGVADRIRSLAAGPRIHSVSLWIWSAGEAFGLDLPPGQLQEIARLGASLKIDVYDVGGEPDSATTGEPPGS